MMMSKQPFSAEITYDVASAVSIGGRDCQEDAIVADFPQGAGYGFVVLADGMGGHAAGDIASRIVVTEVFSELKLQSNDLERFSREINPILRQAARVANACVLAHATADPGTRGMGATLLAPVLLGNRLHWVSVGDSPLYLFRDGKLRQLNEDHSLAPQIDHMVRSGRMTEDRGRNHPDRNCLTSVLIGLEIPRLDCPDRPVILEPGDIVIASSDGLQFLDETDIAALLNVMRDDSSASIAAALMNAIEELADPDQDNVALAVIRLPFDQGGESQQPAAPDHVSRPANGMVHAAARRGRMTVMASRSKSGVAMMCRIGNSRGQQI